MAMRPPCAHFLYSEGFASSVDALLFGGEG